MSASILRNHVTKEKMDIKESHGQDYFQGIYITEHNEHDAVIKNYQLIIPKSSMILQYIKLFK